MTYTIYNDDDYDVYRSELSYPWERTSLYTLNSGYPDREWTLSVICSSTRS